jgi:NADPH:quinone reductase-like Zn-dependent oxidoreductase
MRAFEIQEFGIDNLKLVNHDVPRPGSGEVLVQLRAASLNFRDLMVTEGQYNPKLKRPMIPLSDGIGVVTEIGPGVTRFKTGDRVAGIFMQEWIEGPVNRVKAKSALGGAIQGVLAEYRTFHEDGLVPVPEYLSDVEAACLPCAGVTAWHALFEERPPNPGDTVLIQGTGGVSIFALQFTTAAGLRSVVISSSNEKLERARQLGATHTLNYRDEPEWDKSVLSLLPDGVDCVVEVGGVDTIARSLKTVRMGGMIAVIGALTGAAPSIDPRAILMNTIQVQGIYVGSRSMFERMNRALELRQIRPIVHRVFPWLEVREAMKFMKAQSHLGKICLQFS